MATPVKRMTEAEKSKISAEIQKRAKALAILAFEATNNSNRYPNTPPEQRTTASKVIVTLNMKSRSSSTWSWSNLSGEWIRPVGSTGYLWHYPEKSPQHDIVVERTRQQFPKCSSIPNEFLKGEALSATPEQIVWANGVLEDMGITSETGNYLVEFQTTVKVQRGVHIYRALNPGHAQMQALEQVTHSPNHNWIPIDKIDPNIIDVVKVEKRS